MNQSDGAEIGVIEPDDEEPMLPLVISPSPAEHDGDEIIFMDTEPVPVDPDCNVFRRLSADEDYANNSLESQPSSSDFQANEIGLHSSHDIGKTKTEMDKATHIEGRPIIKPLEICVACRGKRFYRRFRVSRGPNGDEFREQCANRQCRKRGESFTIELAKDGTEIWIAVPPKPALIKKGVIAEQSTSVSNVVSKVSKKRSHPQLTAHASSLYSKKKKKKSKEPPKFKRGPYKKRSKLIHMEPEPPSAMVVPTRVAIPVVPRKITAEMSTQTNDDEHVMSTIVEQLQLPVSSGKKLALQTRQLQLLHTQCMKQLMDVKRQRDSLIDLVQAMAADLKTFRSVYYKEMQRIKDDLHEVAKENRLYHTDLTQAIIHQSERIKREQSRIKLVFDHLDSKRRDLRAQLECKKEELKEMEADMAKETRRCDVLMRDAYLADKLVGEFKNALKDKLFLGVNQQCQGCAARVHIQDNLTSDIARKSNEVEKLKADRDQALKKMDEKERCLQILEKDNRRLQFEVSAWKEDNKRRDRESVMAGLSSSGGDTPGGESSITSHLPFDDDNLSPSSISSNRRMAITNQNISPPSESSPRFESDACKRMGPFGGPDNGGAVHTLSDGQCGGVGEADQLEDVPWLQSQLEGCWNLLAWYRSEMRSQIDQKLFFADRMETDADQFEATLTAKDEEIERVTGNLAAITNSHDALRVKVAQLTRSLSAYLVDNATL